MTHPLTGKGHLSDQDKWHLPSPLKASQPYNLLQESKYQNGAMVFQ